MLLALVAGCTAAAEQNPKVRGRELTAAEQYLVDRSEELLVKKCMERGGFRYWVTQIPGVAEREGPGYVIDDIEWAKTHGYGGRLQRRADRARRNDPNSAYFETLSRAERIRYNVMLDGDFEKGTLTVELPAGGTMRTPRESCSAQAQEQLYGDHPTWFRVDRIATNLTPLYANELMKDKRLLRAVAKWSACMRKAGQDYDDPQQIRAGLPDLTRGLGPGRAHAVEVELAVTEARCARRSALADTAHAVEDEHRAKATRRYREDIATWKHMSVTALARAHDIVATAN
ncbi:hypothetical protein [Streptomyces sp. MAR4 CNX-425]|uniref:hypothetical protein n=1 Tax=Streptomyces sp. MAR4 CNX-425 TaxID=3406343 RepID=UPI003B50C0BC